MVMHVVLVAAGAVGLIGAPTSTQVPLLRLVVVRILYTTPGADCQQTTRFGLGGVEGCAVVMVKLLNEFVIIHEAGCAGQGIIRRGDALATRCCQRT